MQLSSSSWLHSVHQSRCWRWSKSKWGTRHTLRHTPGAEGYVQGREAQVYTVVQADLRIDAVWMVGTSRWRARAVFGGEADKENVTWSGYGEWLQVNGFQLALLQAASSFFPPLDTDVCRYSPWTSLGQRYDPT